MEESKVDKRFSIDPLRALQERRSIQSKSAEVAPTSNRVATVPSGITLSTAQQPSTDLGGVRRNSGRCSVTSANAQTAAERVMHALDPSNQVTFPIITDICERVSARPTEAAAAVHALVEAFADRSAPPQRRFKALTILNELVHDPRATAELRAIPEILEVLQELQVIQDSGLGEDADEQFRIFATELEAACCGNLTEKTSQHHRKRDKAMDLIAGLGSSAQARYDSHATGNKYVSDHRNKDLTRELFHDVGSSVQNNLTKVGGMITSKMAKGNAQTQSGAQSNVSSWGTAFSKNLTKAYNAAAGAAEKGQKAVGAAMQDIQDPAQNEKPRRMPGCVIVPHPMDVLNPNEIEWE